MTCTDRVFGTRNVTSAYTRDTYTSVYPELSHQAADDTAALLGLGLKH